jgi:methionyl-tRNA synthetase
MQEKVLITSALPYANGPLHFGHIAGAYLPGDCFARFKRLQGFDVLYVCGSDEYGIAIVLSAELAKRSPQEQVDLFHGMNKDFFSKLNFSFDHYSRTTWEGHKETVQAFFLDLLHNGHIEEKVTDQLFSQEQNRFLADRYVQGTCPKCGFDGARGDECQSCGASYEAIDLLNPRSKISGSPLVLKKTKHWFLRFDHFQKELLEWIESKNWKPNVVNFALSYIRELKPRAITRDSEWGIPVPLEEAEGKVLYVWFDAPIGYISAVKEWAQLQGDPLLWQKYFLDQKTRYVQFIGKDNIPFHAVFFPAMIMGQNTSYKLVDDLPANEFYNLEGKQFSKSDGWTIDLESFFTEFSVDQIRYVIASNAPETGDSEFTWKDFQSRSNAELLGKYGNFVNRVLVFIQNQMGGVVPARGTYSDETIAFLEKAREIVKETASSYEAFQVRKACQHIMELAQAGNVYFDSQKPWKLAKDPERKKELESILYACLECIQLLALVSFPVIPSTAEKIAFFLGLEKPLQDLGWQYLVNAPIQEGKALIKPEILFNKVEDAAIEERVKALSNMSKQVASHPNIAPLKEQISIDEVKKLDLRVGLILSVERVPKSKKLLRLLVDIGLEKRTVVAGIGESIVDEQTLVGKKAVFVANLQPAKLMGIESQGMILAAKTSEGLELPFLSLANPGDVVS